jgi:hypothetical protein
MNQPPIRLTGHRVRILLAKKPDIGRFLKLIHRPRIPPELAVIELKRSYILVPAMDRLYLALPPQRPRDLRSGHAQRQQHQKYQDNRPHQQKAFFALACPVVL